MDIETSALHPGGSLLDRSPSHPSKSLTLARATSSASELQNVDGYSRRNEEIKKIPSDENKQCKRTSSCKKNSLKFCRRVSKLLLDKINEKEIASSKTLSQFLLFFQSALEQQIDMLSGMILDSQGLHHLHFDHIRKVWERNRNILSEKKNSKLSLVSFEEWETIYGFTGFLERLMISSNNFAQLITKIKLSDESSLKAFIGFYSKLLFSLNVLLLNSIIFIEFPQDKSVKNIIPEIDNFELMTIEPWLYKHYNHTKAKFARECCSTCKICRSSLLPQNFKDRLDKARSRYQIMKKIFQAAFFTTGNIQEINNIEVAIFPFLVYDTWMQN